MCNSRELHGMNYVTREGFRQRRREHPEYPLVVIRPQCDRIGFVTKTTAGALSGSAADRTRRPSAEVRATLGERRNFDPLTWRTESPIVACITCLIGARAAEIPLSAGKLPAGTLNKLLAGNLASVRITSSPEVAALPP
ncbi:hypothetical protein RHA1_ro05475 [Rhodococcus jostii RHA1]|uniref:Uncharacterized protein n=1 Tax=Rhodococcus jostii (strain RHA1) TaxID=101510 RepID=Q0S5D1_RHOJR|nr:hypothetical protein RHA1_ro05475 [Rhodococcus jostii RHA1]